MPGSDIRGINRSRERRRQLRRSVSGNSLDDQVPASMSTPSLHRTSQSTAQLPDTASAKLRRETFTKRRSMAPQRRFTQVVPRNVLLTITQQELQRQEIIFELMLTERQYVEDITMTAEQFLSPLREQELLNKEQLNSVFGNLEALVPVNTDILHALEERKRKFGAVIERVGDIFLDKINLFKLYAIYCSNQRAVAVRIQELYAEIPAFKTFCAAAHKKPFCRGMCLPDFLIAPLQRLCKYPLIFENLLEHTPPSHPDHEKLSAAHAAIKEIVNKVNERTRQVENVEKLSELDRLYQLEEAGLDIVQAQRSFVKKGEAKYQKKGKVPVPCDLLLFNDCILVITNKKGLNHVVMNAPIGDVLLANTDTEDLHFDLVVLRQFTVALHFDSTKIKKAWVNAIRKYRLTVTELPVGEGERIRVRNNTFAGWLSPRSANKMAKLEEFTSATPPPPRDASRGRGQSVAAGSGQQNHISPVLEGKPVKFERQLVVEEPESAEKKLKLQRMTQVQLSLQKLGSDKEKVKELKALLEKEIETTCEMRTMLLQNVARRNTVKTECPRCSASSTSSNRSKSAPKRSQSAVNATAVRKTDLSPSKKKRRAAKAESVESPLDLSLPLAKEAKNEEADVAKAEEKVNDITIVVEEHTGGEKDAKTEEATADAGGSESGDGKTADVKEKEKAEEEEKKDGKEREKSEEGDKRERRENGKAAEEERQRREGERQEMERETERTALHARVKRLEMELDVAKIEVEKVRAGGTEREKNSELLSKTLEIVKDNEELVKQRKDLEELVLYVKSVAENSEDAERGFKLVKEKVSTFQPSSREMPSNHVLNRVRFFEMLNKEIAAQRSTPSSRSHSSRRRTRQQSSPASSSSHTLPSRTSSSSGSSSSSHRRRH